MWWTCSIKDNPARVVLTLLLNAQSLLAILSSLALTHLWHMIAFGIHQMRAGGHPSDGLFWQQQAILRTQAAPSSLIAENARLWWNWRNKAQRAFLRCASQFLLPVVFCVGAVAATISTSFIVDNSDIEVLSRSSECGKFVGALHPDYVAALADATTCRGSHIRPILPVDSSPAACPFEASYCTAGNLPAISMDTGLIDMSRDLGINLEKHDAVKFRRKTTCTVVPVKDRYKVIKVRRPRNPWDETSGSDTVDERVIAVSLGNKATQALEGNYSDVTFLSPSETSMNFAFQ